MDLLIDECCAKSLVQAARDLGHGVQRTINVESLGRSATDPAIFRYAREHGAVLVTINRADFVGLARYGSDHPGVIVLPSVRTKELVRLFQTVLPVAERVFRDKLNAFVEIDHEGTITSFQLPLVK